MKDVAAWAADALSGAIGLSLILLALFGAPSEGWLPSGVHHIGAATLGGLLVWRALMDRE